MWKKRLIQVLWLLAGIGVIVLLGAAIQKKNHRTCAEVKIEITGSQKDVFIDEKDVLDLLNSAGNMVGKDLATIDLKALENALEKNKWVKNAEMFFDNNQLLHVNIEEREPVARVFCAEGSSFYVDSFAIRLPLSDKLSARVPVFTNFPSDKEVLTQSDSATLQNLVKIGKFIVADSFWMAQIAQIDITPSANFEMIPTIGDQLIVLGNAEDLARKFDRLFSFYKQAWLQNGMNKYEKIDVQFDHEVVAVKRGTGRALVDSAKARLAMSEMLQAASMQGKSDSVHTTVKLPVVTKNTVLKDSLAVSKKTGKQINKNVITAKQNKVSNKTLSVSQGSVLPKKAEIKPVKAKAVMGKDNKSVEKNK
jgi:cell division protein FtsQ